MFGYVRPVREELKCREFDLYRATYCGLCRCLRRRYGLLAPMFLNFDFTFLALLLWEPEERFTACRGRCHANPLKRMPMCQDSPALETAADESVILAWWKLRDSVADDGFWGGLPARGLACLLRRAYGRARRIRPGFDGEVARCMEELRTLERDGCPSIDRTADAFARLLRCAAPQGGDTARNRALGELLYHLGRWIYLVDARDDREEDMRRGRYNPLVLRYGTQGDDEALSITLEHSLNLCRSAAQLIPFGCRTGLIENILYLGLPLVQSAVFDGSWSQIKKQKIWRNST